MEEEKFMQHREMGKLTQQVMHGFNCAKNDGKTIHFLTTLAKNCVAILPLKKLEELQKKADKYDSLTTNP